MPKDYIIYLKEVKDKLDSISPTLCLAKWLQVSMHLQNGNNHSCHHVQTHKIDLNELKQDPSALHNTNYKKLQRKSMLEGQRPAECDYCWKIEDTTQNYSDRILKSAMEWAYPRLNEITNSSWVDNINPSYVEVSFSNVCNFKCSYCNPINSSQWLDEIETMGQYPVPKHKYIYDIIPNKDNNPYIEAFWKWLPNVYYNLNTLRITGGEPLLSKDTYKLLDFINDNPNPNLSFAINTNLNPPKNLFDKFIDKITILIGEKKIKNFKIFTSAEGKGAALEYSRFGMNYDTWINNLHKCYQSIPNFSASIMSTYNIFSITTYNEFLLDVLEINKLYRKENQSKPLLLDIPYLRHPDFLSVLILDSEDVNFVENNYQFMKKYTSVNGINSFNNYELEKLERILIMLKNRNNLNFQDQQKNFVKFVDEYDKRRNTNFLKTFPELTKMYQRWSNQ